MVETDRAAVIKLFQVGHKQKQILNLLKMPNGRRMFVYRTIKRYQETGTVEDKVRSGRPSSIITPRVKKAIREQIRRNPRRSMRKIALGMEISRRSVSRIVKNDLGMKSPKRKNVHFMTPQIRQKRTVRSKGLLERHAVYGADNILFSDEKLFTIEEALNSQNDRIITSSVSTQSWLRINISDFVSKEEWPPYSPDLNPMDYSIWSILESKACAKSHTSIQSLKTS